MRQVLIVCLFCLCIVPSFQCSRWMPSEQSGPTTYPNDQFFFTRMYPDTVFPLQAYTSALEQAAIENATRISGTRSDGEDWQLEGPFNISGRINTIAIHPENHDIILIGLASGGIFKTINGGLDWYPVFDDFSYIAIAHIVFDVSDPDVLYAGTGDPNISGFPFIGDGLYKSVDGGETWTYTGLEEVGIISRLIVHPAATDIVYAGAMGLPFERNEHRGLYKSTDAGSTWQQVLFIDDDAGVIDIEADPGNPDVVYAAVWNRIRNNHESVVSGLDAGIWKTTDGGATWTELSLGLPGGAQSRISIEMHPDNPEVLYASYVGTSLSFNGLFKTENGGASWSSLDIGPVDGVMSGFGWYFDGLQLNPYNPSQLFVQGVDLVRTENDGDDWDEADDFTVHADKHAMAFLDADSYLLATDGGLYKTNNDAVSWVDAEDIQSSQFYHVDLNPHEPGVYWGGMQDNGTAKGNAASADSWEKIYGADGFHSEFRSDDDNIFYVEYQNGGIIGYDGFDFFNATTGIVASDRRNWNAPYMISRFDDDVLYTGTYRMYKSTAGVYPNFSPISSDLTDGIIFGSGFHTLTTINEDFFDSDILYAGTTDANVWRTLNGGASWDNITMGLPEHYVTDLITSPSTPNRIFVTHSGYKENEFIPHIHRSDDNGTTWNDISGDLPNLAINAMVVHPHNDDYIFVATDGGVYFTENGGGSWERMGYSMPILAVYDIEFDLATNRIVAGTYARGIWSIAMAGWLPPVVDVMAETNVCAGDTIVVTASGAETYSWLFDGVTVPCSGDCAEVSFSPSGSGTLEVTGLDAFGLTSTETISITVHPVPEWGTESILPGDCEVGVYCCFVVQEPEPGVTYLWYTWGGSDEFLGEGDSLCIYEYGLPFYVQAVTAEGCASSINFNENGYPSNIVDGQELWNVYPNPAADYLTVETLAAGESIFLELYDVSGRRVAEWQVSGTMQLDIRALASGTYFLREKGVDGVLTVVKE
jgi:photosystem II stability/assembly factor-like uncharacterized protein